MTISWNKERIGEIPCYDQANSLQNFDNWQYEKNADLIKE